MSIDHKAYVFDYDRFAIELKSNLEEALLTENINSLIIFIRENLSFLKDPDLGKPLDINWEKTLINKDVHEYGDFALTKFYDPEDCIGLSNDWREIDDLLCYEFGEGSLITLGKILGPKDNFFDPGKMGAYFQSPHQVQKNLIWLEDTLEQRPELLEYLISVINMLKPASKQGQGLYITF
jgi:hypothetical protein